MKKTTFLRALKTLFWKHIKTQPHSPTAPARRAGALSLLAARRACLWTALGLFAALAFGAQSTRAAVVEGWVHRYSNVVSNSNDQAVKVVRDAVGDIIVTGNTEGDMLTIKYSSADGTVIWQQRYNGPANSSVYASAVAVDASGSVVVTGISLGNGGYDYYTAKLAAVDGALLWEKRYNGPAKNNDFAKAIAVDGSGNVVVTGSSGYEDYWGEYYDYYTAKYAAADGALLWEKRYNGPAHGDDKVGLEYFRTLDPSSRLSHNLALGLNGMVAITGFSDGNFGHGTAYDYATVVYWENLPPVSIELEPSGSRLRFTGVPGRTYTIERAPAVTGPWTTLATPTTPPDGLIDYVDTNPPARTTFYRTVQP